MLVDCRGGRTAARQSTELAVHGGRLPMIAKVPGNLGPQSKFNIKMY